MWEIFSLGTVPYPGLVPNEELFLRIQDGYRMDKPKFATQDLFNIMLNCWKVSPKTRPLFKELEEELDFFLDPSIQEVKFLQL